MKSESKGNFCPETPISKLLAYQANVDSRLNTYWQNNNSRTKAIGHDLERQAKDSKQ